MRWLVLSALVVGCGVNGPSHGELGHAQFQWNEGALGCLFGCNASAPMAARSSATLDVTNSKTLPALAVTTDDASILTVKGSGGSSIALNSHAVGRAKVILNDAATGTPVDRFAIDVKDVAKIETVESGLFKSQLTIVEGGEKQIQLRLKESGGKELEGVGGVDYAFAGSLGPEQVTLATAIGDAIASIFVGSNTEYARVKAIAAGTGELDITSPGGASLKIPAAVVATSAITRLTIDQPAPVKVGRSISVTASAFVGEERAWSPPCTWALSPPMGAISVSKGRDFATLSATSAGTATVTCTVNGLTASATATFSP